VSADLNTALSQKLSDGRITLKDATAVQAFAQFLQDVGPPKMGPLLADEYGRFPRWVLCKWGRYLIGEADGPIVWLSKIPPKWTETLT
jgi:hypothetical protein